MGWMLLRRTRVNFQVSKNLCRVQRKLQIRIFLVFSVLLGLLTTFQ